MVILAVALRRDCLADVGMLRAELAVLRPVASDRRCFIKNGSSSV
jgi:hypothetical protein